MSPDTTTETRTRAEVLDETLQRGIRMAPAFAHWLPRIVVAAIFIELGFAHLADFRGFAASFDLAEPVAFLVAMGEVSIAAFLLLGGFRTPYADLVTRSAGALLIVIMAGAIQKAHWARWHFAPADGFPMGGMEFQVTLLAVGLFFVLRGAHHTRY